MCTVLVKLVCSLMQATENLTSHRCSCHFLWQINLSDSFQFGKPSTEANSICSHVDHEHFLASIIDIISAHDAPSSDINQILHPQTFSLQSLSPMFLICFSWFWFSPSTTLFICPYSLYLDLFVSLWSQPSQQRSEPDSCR